MSRAPRRNSGFSLVELMIAMTIGLLLLAGLVMIFVNSSESNRELQKTAQQIENGRYAIDVLSQDLRLAGFYGHLHELNNIAMPGMIPPDPCVSALGAALTSTLRFPVQGYRGTIDATTAASDARANISSTTCAGLVAANLRPGSDVLVIRRADTNPLGATDTTTANGFYIQSTAFAAEIQLGGGAAIGTCPSANEHCKADGTTPSALKLANGAAPAPSAPIRRLRVHIYFVAPCSIPNGGGTLCTGASDDGGRPIPTLKRLELTSSGTITIVPMVEGIEYFKVEYGVDTAPTNVNVNTGYIGDGTVDSYTQAPADWATVIAAKLYLLARNTEPTQGFTDTKTYLLGSAATDNFAVPAAAGAEARYKRHVYTAAVQLVNSAGRREIP
ncbi:MAG TPA: PilW family protein [Burkholderiales bacterium]|nr:PilW family protein [Burkholderiales bacterium]